MINFDDPIIDIQKYDVILNDIYYNKNPNRLGEFSKDYAYEVQNFLNDFTFQKEISSNSNSIICSAFNSLSNENCVFRLIFKETPYNSVDSDNFIKHISRDIEAMNTFSNVPEVITYDYAGKILFEEKNLLVVYLKMDLLICFDDYINCYKSNFNQNEVVKIFHDILISAKSIHQRNIIHRNIKRQNLFIDKSGHVRIGDLRKSRSVIFDDDNLNLTLGVGTSNYIAPFITDNYRQLDIYSIGMEVYRLLNNGDFPFQDDRLRWKGTPIPKPANGSEDLVKIVLKCLNDSPTSNYQSIEEVLEDLERLVYHQSKEEQNSKYAFKQGCDYIINNNTEKAIECFKKSAEYGVGNAQHNCGVYYLSIGDYSQAMNYFKLAIDNGITSSMYNLGRMYELGFNSESAVNYEEAKKYYQLGASNNDEKSINRLVYIYKNVYHDINSVIKLYERLSNDGNALAMYNLYVILNHIDIKKSLEYLELSAQNGVKSAMYDYACYNLYYSQDYFKAFEYFKKCADLDIPQAEYNTAVCYITGIGTIISDDLAIKYLNKAIEHNHEKAQSVLDFMLDN